MRNTTVHFSANLSRLLILLLVVCLLATCFTGCFTYDPLGKETTGSPAFDPDGDDEPDQPTDSTKSTDATTGTEATSGTQDPDPTTGTTDPTTGTTEPTTGPTEPTESATQPTTTPVYADPIAYGMVTATELYIRKGPGTNYDKVGSYTFNTRVTIYARNGKWGQTKDGWISMDFVYVDGTVGNMNSEKGTLIGDYVNVRSGPGTEYGVVRTTRKDDRVTILHKVTINGKDWGCMSDGWIRLDFVQLDKDKTAETEPTETTEATEATEATNASEPADSTDDLSANIVGTWVRRYTATQSYEKDGVELEAEGTVVEYLKLNADGTYQSQWEFQVDSQTVKARSGNGTYAINGNMITVDSTAYTISIKGNVLTVNSYEYTRVS